MQSSIRFRLVVPASFVPSISSDITAVGNGEPVPKTMKELMMKALSAALVHCPSLKSELDDSRKLVSLVQIVDNQKPKPISGVIALNMDQAN